MGSASKVILIGATSLIVGVYATSLKKVQAGDLETALARVSRIQTERVEDAAARVVVSRISPYLSYTTSYPYYTTITGQREALGGGYFTYTMEIHSTYATATVTLYQTGAPKVITIRADKMTTTKPGFRRILRGQWQVTKYYVSPVA